MTFREWIKDYPYLIPCVYCDYYRAISGGKKMPPSWYLKKREVAEDWFDYTRMPVCYYSLVTNQPRGDPPLDGKCSKFQPKKRFYYLKEDFKK